MCWCWPKIEENHPQYGLGTFYIGATVYLSFEVIIIIIWFVQMFLFQFLLPTGAATEQYRTVNSLMIFHLGVPITMQNVVQQTKNDNSVLWWTLFPFLLGLGGDFQTLLQLCLENVTKTTLWAYRFALALSIINFSFTVFGICWYIVWFILIRPKGIPTDAAFRNMKKRSSKMREPLLSSVPSYGEKTQ